MEWANCTGLIGIVSFHKLLLCKDFLKFFAQNSDNFDSQACLTYNTNSLIHHVWKEIGRRPSGRRLSFQDSRLSYFFWILRLLEEPSR